MKKYDWTICLGIFTGLSAIFTAAWFENLNSSYLWNPTAFLIVGGGTLGAVIVRRGTKGVSSSIRAIFGLRLADDDGEEHRVKLARLAWLARAASKKGPKTYEDLADQIDDVLVANGFVLLAENISTEQMRETLKSRIDWECEQGLRDIKTIEAAGGFAPTFGILGAVIGLTSVLRMIDDPAALGAGIASAFVATIYGIGSANLLFFPIASRLRERHEKEISRRDEIASVLLALNEQEPPRAIINQFNLMK